MTAITVDAGLQPRRSFQEVWVISLGHALTHWYPATFYLLLPLIGKELGLSYSEIGAVLTCQYLAGAIANIPGGIFVDSVGRKGLLMAVSLFWIGFPYLMMGTSHAYWMILCCATLVGIGNNLWHPSAISWLANRFPRRKGLVMSIHSMGGNVGDAVAPLVAGALLGVLSWRDVVIVNVLPGMLLAVFIMFYLGRKQGVDRDAGLADTASSAISGFERLRMFGALLKNRALITLAAGSAFRTVSLLGFFLFAVRAVLQAWVLDATPPAMGGSAIGLLFASQAFGQAVGPLSAGIVADHFGLMGAFYFLATTIVIANFLVFLTPAGLMKRG